MDDSLFEKQLSTGTSIGQAEVQCEDTFSDEKTVVVNSNDQTPSNLPDNKYSPKSVAHRGEDPPSNGGVVTNVVLSIVPDQKEDSVHQKANIVCNNDNPYVAGTKLTSAASIFQTGLHYPTGKITELSIDVPTTAKNTPFISSPATKSAITTPNEQATRTSSKDDIEQQPPMSLKCFEMKANLFDDKSVKIPLGCEIDAPVIIDRESNVLPITDSEWNSKDTVLPHGWPKEAISDTVDATELATRRTLPVIPKSSALPMLISNVENTVHQPHDPSTAELSSRLSTSADKSKRRVSAAKVQSSLDPRDSENTSGCIDSALGSARSRGRKLSTDEAVQSSRLLASSRVTAKLREVNRLAKLETENKAQSLLVAQIVTERKAAELHAKTLERLSLRKGAERGRQLKSLQLEEEQKLVDDAANDKSDERMLRMDEFRKKTLVRMKAAKVKINEDEQLKEKTMVDRLRTLGLQTGRAASVPLPFNYNAIQELAPSGIHNIKISKGSRKLRESLSAGAAGKLSPRFENSVSNSGKTLPPIGTAGLDPFSPMKRKDKKSKPKFLSKVRDPFRSGTDHPLLEPISAGSRVTGRAEPLREGVSPMESEMSAFYDQNHGNDTGIADDSLDNDMFDVLTAAVPDARQSRERIGPYDKNLKSSSSNFLSSADTAEFSGKGSFKGEMEVRERERVACDGATGHSEDDPCNMSELSSEEHSACESQNSPAAGPISRSKGKNRKQSAPWRALKPIVLKPFISIQREDT